MACEDDLRGVICRAKGCDELMISECKAESGAIKELFYCQKDGCFFVKVNGRERMRSDSKATALGYFNSEGIR